MASIAQEAGESVDKTVESTVKPPREKSRTEAMEKAKEMKEETVQKRKEVQEEIMQRREEAKEEFAKERVEFKMKLQEISDERKQEIVEKVDAHIAEMNERITGKLAEHLDRISEIIDRIEEKAGDLEGDTKTVDDAITVARAAVETSQEAVSEQAGKEYIIELSEENNLGTDVKTAIKTFRTDMKATVETVKEARQKTIDAARALGKLQEPVNDDSSETTESETTEELGG